MLDWYATILALIDLRSFSNLWYWIVLAAFWWNAGRRMLGVPVDVLTRAHALGGVAAAELDAAVDLAVLRILRIARGEGVLRLATAAFALALVLMLGFGYGLELGQAAAFLLLPHVILRGMEVATARRVEHGPRGEALQSLLFWHRFRVQILGLIFILLTAFWGAWWNTTMTTLHH